MKVQCPAVIDLGDRRLMCVLDNGHDNPMNEIGSRQTISLHSANFKNLNPAISDVYVKWRTPGLFGEANNV